MGGQGGDIGVINGEDGAVFKVLETIHVAGGRTAHVGEVVQGSFKVGSKVSLEVDKENRAKTCRNHSATHLLQKALQEVLGDSVEQAGSYQDPDKTRFDFSYHQAMTAEEIEKVETIVNAKVLEALPVVTNVMSIDEAKKTGAMALFGEKYGETVRVVNMGDFSIELCGGTHVANTSHIGLFKIVSESGVAAGVRRIEALTGDNARAYYNNVEDNLNNAAKALKTNPSDITVQIKKLQEELKALRSENESLKSKEAQAALGDVMDQVKEVNGVKLLATAVKGVDMNGLRDLGDQMKTKLGEGVVVLISEADGKVNLVTMATDGAMAKGAHAGNLVKAIAPKVGGGGGGRPNMAQAGGKNPAGIADAIAEAEKVLAEQIK
jgi:alanyl-tRNA synthetase